MLRVISDRYSVTVNQVIMSTVNSNMTFFIGYYIIILLFNTAVCRLSHARSVTFSMHDTQMYAPST